MRTPSIVLEQAALERTLLERSVRILEIKAEIECNVGHELVSPRDRPDTTHHLWEVDR